MLRRRRLLPGLLRRRRHGYVCFRCRDTRRLVYRSTAVWTELILTAGCDDAAPGNVEV